MMRALFLILAGLLAGCIGHAPSVPVDRIDVGTGGYFAHVAEVRLSDGTPCAVLIGADGRGGITCNWSPR